MVLKKDEVKDIFDYLIKPSWVSMYDNTYQSLIKQGISGEFSKELNSFNELLIYAIPTIVWMQKNRNTIKENSYKDITNEADELIRRTYFDFETIDFVFHNTNSLSSFSKYISYVCGIFCNSTIYLPYIMDMTELIQYLYNRPSSYNAPNDINPIETCAMLIIYNVYGNFNRLKNISGDFRSILIDRALNKRLTIFTDILPTELLNDCGKKKINELQEQLRRKMKELLPEPVLSIMTDMNIFYSFPMKEWTRLKELNEV